MKVTNTKSHPKLERVVRAKYEFNIALMRLKATTLSARKSGYSLREVAKAAGVSNVTILNWERERNGDK